MIIIHHIDAHSLNTIKRFKVRPEDPVITNGPSMEVKIALLFLASQDAIEVMSVTY